MLATATITENTCAAVLRAGRQYYEWSNGSTLHDDSVEPLMSVAIARHMRDAGNGFISFETSFKKLKERSRATHRRLRRSRNSRVDVAYYGQNTRPVGIFEIKRHFYWNSVRKDVDRIADALVAFGIGTAGSLRWGCIVGFHTAWNTSKLDLDEKAREIRQNIQGKYPGLRTQHCVQSWKLPKSIERDGRLLMRFEAACVLMKVQAR